MNLFIEDGVAKAKVSVDGACIRVPLTFVMNVQVGDDIIVNSGVALSEIESQNGKEVAYVLGNPR